jgi:CheY-like chemotaxis protein
MNVHIAAPEPGRPVTVLVVEDEDTIRAILQSALTAHGYRVLVASSGAEALQLCAQHAGPIELVVTDLLMPGMNGDVLIRQLLPSRPGIHVIYISGYPGPDTTLPPGDTGRTTFVPKPFTPKELIEVVREILR